MTPCAYRNICETEKCPTIKQRAKWNYLKCFARKKPKDTAKDVEKSSDKNTINTASTVGKHGKEKRSSRGKSVGQ